MSSNVTPLNRTDTPFRFDPEANKRRLEQERIGKTGSARAQFAASTGLDATEHCAPPNNKPGSSFHYPVVGHSLTAEVKREITKRIHDNTFTWEWAEQYGIKRLTKADAWDEVIDAYADPERKPAYHAEHLMNFVLSDLKDCSPVTRLVAGYYATFFNPYKGSLHPEFFRVAISLGLTEEEYLLAVRELAEASSVLIPVRSKQIVASGYWMSLSLDAEARILDWLDSSGGSLMRKSFHTKRRTLIKYNLRYAAIGNHVTQLLSTILACRVPVDGNMEGDFQLGSFALPYRWIAGALGVSEGEAIAAVEELKANCDLWDVECGNGGALFSVSAKGKAEYEEYHPFVLYTGKQAEKRGLNETEHYERKMRQRRGVTEAWLGTSSEWGKGDDREEWELYPHEHPDADGCRGAWGNKDEQWVFIYGIYCPITGELMYVGMTTRKLLTRLLEHMDRPGITTSDAMGSIKKEHNPLMANWLRLLASLGLEPVIKVINVIKGVRAAHKFEGEYVREYEEQHGPVLLNLEHSRYRPDYEYKKAVRFAEKAKQVVVDLDDVPEPDWFGSRSVA